MLLPVLAIKEVSTAVTNTERELTTGRRNGHAPLNELRFCVLQPGARIVIEKPRCVVTSDEGKRAARRAATKGLLPAGTVIAKPAHRAKRRDRL